MKENYAAQCLAVTRGKTLCKKPPIKGKRRCRLHGGAEGSGAPKNNTNAFKHGLYSRESIQSRKETNRIIRQCKSFMNEIRL